jgi:hypothetical protein
VAAPRNVYSVSYQPANNAGAAMWINYEANAAQYSADLAKIASLGFNTVRAFLAAVDGAFDYPGPPTSGELANLNDFLSRANAAGLKVHLNLFDSESNYGQVAASKAWAETVIGAITDLSYVQCIEIKNEIPFVYAVQYGGAYDSGWPLEQSYTVSATGTDVVTGSEFSAGMVGLQFLIAGTAYAVASYQSSTQITMTAAVPTGTSVPMTITTGTAGTVWVQQMIPYLRGITSLPLPISCAARHIPTGDAGTLQLSGAYAALHGTSAAPDWYEWHCYTTPQEISSSRNIAGISSIIYDVLSQVISAVGDPSLLFIGETGLNTTPGATGHSTVPAQMGQVQVWQCQVNYIWGVRWACWQLGLPEPAPWVLYDIIGNAYYAAQTFGLYTATGHAKPITGHYQQIAPGSDIPGVPMNGNMSGPPQADAAGNLLPPQWTLFQGSSNDQTIAATVDPANPWNGNIPILLTGSADSEPALEWDSSAGFPLLTGQNGHKLTWYVIAKAEGDYGDGVTYPHLTVDFYQFEWAGSVFVSSHNGTLLTLTDEYAVYSLVATIPVCDYARFFFFTGANAGSIWVAAGALNGPLPVLARRGATWYRRAVAA